MFSNGLERSVAALLNGKISKIRRQGQKSDGSNTAGGSAYSAFVTVLHTYSFNPHYKPGPVWHHRRKLEERD